MIKTYRITILAFLLLGFTINTYSQEFLEERTMKLTEISTDKTYGYEFKNPIKVGSNEIATGAFLNALKYPTGERMHIADMKFDVKEKTGLQMVVLSFEGLTETKTLYISTIDFEQPKAPIGFLFKTIDDIPKVKEFPSDSIIKVEICNSEKIYSVDDFLLKEKIGEYPEPKNNPEFKGGIKELIKYFSENPLTDEVLKNLMFKVKISFVVNCDGKAGDFQIISKGRGDLKTYANQVLEVVNKMPQKWKSATYKKNNVDCYQILSFTVMEGKLDKVSYR